MICSNFYGNNTSSVQKSAKGLTKLVSIGTLPILTTNSVTDALKIMYDHKTVNLILKSKRTSVSSVILGDMVRVVLKNNYNKRGDSLNAKAIFSIDC